MCEEGTQLHYVWAPKMGVLSDNSKMFSLNATTKRYKNVNQECF